MIIRYKSQHDKCTQILSFYCTNDNVGKAHNVSCDLAVNNVMMLTCVKAADIQGFKEMILIAE